MAELMSSGVLGPALFKSLIRMVVGYGLSLGLGLSLGFLVARVPWVDQTAGTLVLSLQALPSLCWVPLAALWLGAGERAVLFIVVMGSFVSVVIATQVGIRNIPPLTLDAAKTLGARGIKLTLQVVLPAALPSMLTGMKLAWAFAWRSLLGAEMLLRTGLGSLLVGGQEQGDMAQVVAIMLAILLVGVGVDQGFNYWERRVRRIWGYSP